MTTKVRWGILSTAQIVQEELLPAFMDASNAEVVAIASSNNKVYDIASKFEIPTIYGTYEELLDDPSIDAVYIPLPNALHSHWVKKAAEKGKHVFCEKPAALTAREAEEMIEVCKKNGVMFMEAFMYQFHPQHKRVKEIIASGEIGQLKIMRVSLSFFLEDQAGNIRMNQKLGGGSLYDVGCYCIHSIRNILNAEPTRVFASTRNDSDNRVDMSVSGIMEFDNGVTALFDAAMDRTRTDYYEIIGTKGSIRVPRAFVPQMCNGEGHIVISGENGNYRVEHIYGHQYVLEVEYFSKCVLEGEAPESLMENTINNMNVIDACFESIGKETFITVTPLIQASKN
ncbi:Gfo/Idh/MocA family oxidoreductase [Ectobacillus funiculus]|uniref:Gfo/Idh/MocA family protein n=1 Tax=Ectobacillus funiculus TaxID=137993 RepID=UPI003978B377